MGGRGKKHCREVRPGRPGAEPDGRAARPKWIPGDAELVSRLSVERGLTEYEYLRRYPYRIVIIHAGAWLRDKTLAVAALSGSSGDAPRETSGGSGDLWEDTPLDESGNTLEKLRGNGQMPQTGPDARRTGAKLPHWYDRSFARRHIVSGLEDDAGRLMMMSWKLAGKEGLFRPGKKIRKVETYKQLGMYDAIKKVGGALSGVAKGEVTGW